MPISSQPFDALPRRTDPSLHLAMLNRGVQGGARDYSADGDDMAVFGSPVFERVGARFDGAADYLRRAEADWRSGDEQGTIVAWIKRGAYGAIHVIWCSAREVIGSNYLQLRVQSDRLAVSQDNGLPSHYRGSTFLLAARWYHVAAVSTGDAYALYVDGQLETFSSETGTAGEWLADTPDRDNVVIGVLRTGVLANYFNGEIRRVDYYSEPKSADWIEYDFQRGVPDDTLVMHIFDGQRDLSRRRVAITVSVDCIKGHEMIFTNGGITWAAQAIIGYGYWYRGVAPDFWRYYFWDGVRRYINGEYSAGAMPVVISATGFANVTGTMKDIKTYSS